MRTKIQDRDLFRVANSVLHTRPWQFSAGTFRIRLPLSAAAVVEVHHLSMPIYNYYWITIIIYISLIDVNL